MYLTALVIRLRATENATLSTSVGRAIQQLALTIIKQHNPALASSLHESDQLKPYATAGLFQTGSVRPLSGAIPAGTDGWVRITGISPEIHGALEAFAHNAVSTVEIEGSVWTVEETIFDTQLNPWSGQTTPAGLWQFHAEAPAHNTLTLHFATPTSFHSQGNNIPLPLPELVFGSLMDRWDDFAPLPVPDLMSEFVDQLVVISKYRTETRLVRFKSSGSEVGFVGTVTYLVLDRNHSLHKQNPALAHSLLDAYPMLLRAIHMLSSFAFYSGVGIRTSMGMGMCRLRGENNNNHVYDEDQTIKQYHVPIDRL